MNRVPFVTSRFQKDSGIVGASIADQMRSFPYRTLVRTSIERECSMKRDATDRRIISVADSRSEELSWFSKWTCHQS